MEGTVPIGASGVNSKIVAVHEALEWVSLRVK